MTPGFPKTDLAMLLALPMPARALALIAALRLVDERDLTRAGCDEQHLAVLANEGLLFRFEFRPRPMQPAQTTVLALRRAGAVRLAELMAVDADSIHSSTRTSCNRSAMFLDHTLARNRFALMLADALAKTGRWALLSWEHDAERLADAVHQVRGRAELVRQPLVADGLAVVRGPNGPEGLLVEVDRGTERPSYLGRKYGGYLTWWRDEDGPKRRFGLSALRLLTVAPEARRTARLRATAADVTNRQAPRLFWFAAEDALVRDGVLSDAWCNLRSERNRLWP